MGGFSIIMILAVGIGVYGIYGLTSISSAADRAYRLNTLPIGKLATVADRIERVRINLRDFITTNDAQQMDEYSAAIERMWKEVETSLKAYSDTLVTSGDRQRYDALSKAVADYRSFEGSVMDLARRQKDQEAVALLFGRGRDLASTLQTAIDTVVADNVTNAADSAAADAALAGSTTAILIAVLAAALAGAV
ncbi:MCP four helix bundle domain-containing protein, partial [Salinispira pacifica]